MVAFFVNCHPMLEVKNISKTYSGESYKAVNDVTLSVNKNEIMALVGMSGSGKSTMLQIIAGLMKPDQGEVIFKGDVLGNPDEQLIAGHPKIKVVFQDFQLKPNMTVEENVRYKLLQFDKTYQVARTAELLKLCNLAGLEARKPKELSGGQKQRLSIARALADDPELLLMDEPFSNLDPLSKQGLLLELVEIINAEDLGLVFVTHDTRDAMLVADRIVFLTDGRLIQNDTTKNVYQKPVNLDVAEFFGRVNSVSTFTGEPQTYVRAESIQLGSSHDYNLTVQIIKSIFLGNEYLLEAVDKATEKRLFLFSNSSAIEAGSSLEIGFDASDMLRFH